MSRAQKFKKCATRAARKLSQILDLDLVSGVQKFRKRPPLGQNAANLTNIKEKVFNYSLILSQTNSKMNLKNDT